MKRLSSLLLALLLIGCGGGGGGGSGDGGGVTSPVAPTATTAGASSITVSTATLNASVNPNGSETLAWLEWSPNSNLQNPTITAKKSVGAGTTLLAINESVGALNQGTTYYYRIVAQNPVGTANGSIVKFTTAMPLSPPIVSTQVASSVTGAGAQLNGTVFPNGLATEAWFEWGTSSTLLPSFKRTPPQAIGAGNIFVSVNDNLTELTTGQTYYFRTAASNSLGNVKGDIASFIGGGVGGGGGMYYSTDFNLTEIPISEGGNWINGGDTGLDWHNVQTGGGYAYGTPAAIRYSDSTAVLAGSWGADQYIVGVVYSAGPDASQFEEVELRLRTTITAHSITGYEVNLRCLRGHSESYLQIAKWVGPLATEISDFIMLFEQTGADWGVQNGDVVRAEIFGDTIRVWVNGELKATVVDPSPVPSGSPGIGMNYGAGQTPSNFGWELIVAGSN